MTYEELKKAYEAAIQKCSKLESQNAELESEKTELEKKIEEKELRMPSTIPLMISEPQLHASLARFFTKFTALLKPFTIVSLMPVIVLETADFTLFQMLDTVVLMLFITFVIVFLIAFQMFDTVVEIAFRTPETVDEIVFQTEEIIDQIEFKIPEIKPYTAFHTVVITL